MRSCMPALNCSMISAPVVGHHVVNPYLNSAVGFARASLTAFTYAVIETRLSTAVSVMCFILFYR